MDDARAVEGRERAGDLTGDLDSLAPRERLAVLESLAEAPAEVLHRDVGGAVVGLPDREHLDEVRVAEVGEERRLLEEALSAVRIVGEEDLHRGSAAEHAILAEDDAAHAAATEHPNRSEAPIDSRRERLAVALLLGRAEDGPARGFSREGRMQH